MKRCLRILQLVKGISENKGNQYHNNLLENEMTAERTHPLYPYTDDDKLEIRRELGLKQSMIEEDVDTIYDWFQKQPHLVDAGIDKDFIERVLIGTKGSLERAKRRIDCYYKHRANAPELVQNRENYLSNSRDLWSNYIQISIPTLFKGNRISLIRFTTSDTSNVHWEEFLTNCFMFGDIRMKYDYFLSDMWIVDLKHVTFAHILKMNAMITQKAAYIFHEGLGLRIHSVHILNGTNLLNHAINLFRQFMGQKILDRIMVHDSSENLHEYIPKRYLPADYGGEQPETTVLRDLYEKEIRSTNTRQFIINASKMISDEKKRPNVKPNEEYLDGSFRKLEID